MRETDRPHRGLPHPWRGPIPVATHALLLMGGLAASPSGLASTPADAARFLVPMDRFYLVDARSRDVVCNDGSPAAYYYRPGVSADTWVVHLGTGGGGGCKTAVDCDDRWVSDPDTMATTWDVGGVTHEIAATRIEGGILSDDPTENPYLHDANHVFVYPCSNDSWGGDADATIDSGFWEFRGARIAPGVLEDLATEHALSIHDATEVYLTGSNSGSDGVRRHLQSVTVDFAAHGVQIHGITDGRFYTELRPPGWDVWTDEVDPALVKFALYDAEPPPTCFDDLGPQSKQCFLLHAHYPYIADPYFLVIPQRDTKVLTGFLGVPDPNDLSHPGVIAHTTSVRDAANALPADVGLFVPDTTWHINTLLTSHFTNYAIPDSNGVGVTMADAIESWRSGAGVPRLVD